MITIKTKKDRLCFKKGPFQSLVDIPDRIYLVPILHENYVDIGVHFQMIKQPYVAAKPEIQQIKDTDENSSTFGMITQHHIDAQPEIPQTYQTVDAVNWKVEGINTLKYGIEESTKEIISALESSTEKGFDITCESSI